MTFETYSNLKSLFRNHYTDETTKKMQWRGKFFPNELNGCIVARYEQEWGHEFHLFPNAAAFEHRLDELLPDYRRYHEVGWTTNRKFVLDLDWKIKDYGPMTQEEWDDGIEEYISALEDMCCLVQQRDDDGIVNRQHHRWWSIIRIDSTDPEIKFSTNLVLHGFYSSCKQHKWLLKELIDRVGDMTRLNTTEGVVDTGLYGKNKSVRTVGSRKLGSSRVKRVVSPKNTPFRHTLLTCLDECFPVRWVPEDTLPSKVVSKVKAKVPVDPLPDEILIKLLEKVPDEKWDRRASWFRLGCIIYNLSGKIEIYDNFSQKSDYYDIDELEKTWESIAQYAENPENHMPGLPSLRKMILE